LFPAFHRDIVCVVSGGCGGKSHCLAGRKSIGSVPNLKYGVYRDHILIVATNYYDPFLAAWKLVPLPNGQTLANTSLKAATELNEVIESVSQAYHIPAADVAEAFHISNFTPLPEVNLPLNVFLTLTCTWMGAPAPFGPNIHPNAAGYAVIAGAFAEKIAIRSDSDD
jgi:lysophospholipase L1-like esterase